MELRLKRRGGLALALAAITAGVVGCGTSSPTGSGGSSASAASALLTAKTPHGVTLTMWHSTADTPALMSLYKRYEQATGDKIQFLNAPAASFGMVIQSKWATGARPDILEWQGNDADAQSLNMAHNGVALTTLPFVKKEGSLAKLSGSDDGQVYAATLGPLLIYGLYYNKQIFAKAGLTPPKDYADLARDCTTLKGKDAGVTPIYEAAGSSFPPQALASFLYTGQYNVGGKYASEIVHGSQKLSDPTGPFVSGLKAYAALKASGCFNSNATTATWPEQTDAVLKGQAAMMAEDSNSIAQLDAQAGSDQKVDSTIGFVAVSATRPVANTSPNPIGTFYVPRTGDTKKEEAAIGFIKFVTSSAQYQEYVDQAGSIPTLSGTTIPKLQSIWQEAEAASKRGAGLTLNSEIPGFGNNFGNESDDLLAGQQSPTIVGQKMQAFVEQAQAALGKG